MLQFDTDCVKGKTAPQQVAKPGKVWQPTQYSNCIRCVPSGTFFARWRVGGNLIRKSLKTDLLTVAKLRLADLDKNERGFVETRQTAGKGRMTFGDCLGIFKTQTETSSLLKPSAKRYCAEVVKSILASWPGLEPLKTLRLMWKCFHQWKICFRPKDFIFQNVRQMRRFDFQISRNE